MLNNEHKKPYSYRERKILELATIGGLTDQEAFWKVYKPKDAKIGMSSLSRKKRTRPELFEEIARYKKELFDAAAKAQREAVQATAAANALTAIEKREKLRMIIEGEADEEVIFQHLGKALKVKKAPGISDRIRAIDLDNKMAGHYAPSQIRHDAGDQFIEMMKIIGQRNKETGAGSGSLIQGKKEGSGENIPAKKTDDFIDKPSADNTAG